MKAVFKTTLFILTAVLVSNVGISASADVFSEANNDSEVLYFAYANDAAGTASKVQATSVIDVNDLENYFDDVVQDQEQGTRHQAFAKQLTY